jgi:hypothetical protein
LDLTLETITPEMAKAWLELNIPNRSLTRTTVLSYARDMKAGRWQVSADPIRFNVEGKLFDGQHRLAAAIEAGVPFTSLVARGLPVDTVDVIDSGRMRKASDMLAIRGYTNAFALAAAARWLLVMRLGLPSQTGNVLTLRPSHNEIMDIVMRHPDLAESASKAVGVKGSLPSILAAVHYVGKFILKAQNDEGVFLADAFVEVMRTGQPFYKSSDPALKLREMDIDERIRKLRSTQRAIYVRTIYTWNAFAAGTSIPQFRPPEVIAMRGLRPSAI